MTSPLPIMLQLTGRPCLLVGGGTVALRRARSLQAAGAHLTVVAPEIHPELQALSDQSHARPWQVEDLAGVFLVVIATDNSARNKQIADAAKAAGVLVNQTDAPEDGDIQFPASGTCGPVTVSVHSGGGSARMAAELRERMLATLTHEEIALLTNAAKWRQPIRQALQGEARQKALKALVGAEAHRILQEQGADALDAFSEALCGD